MNRKLKNLAVAAGASLTLVAGAVQPAAAAAYSSIVAAYPPPTGEFPTEWPVLVDDTQVLNIAVPAAWAQTDTVPAMNDDGTPRPWISATTDESAFFPAAGAADTFSVPGIVYAAVPYSADTAAMVESSQYHDVCTAEPAQTFTNGTYAGHVQNFTGCAGTATRVLQIAAHPADNAFTALVLVQLTGQPDDAGTLNGVLSALGRHVAPTA